MSWNDIKGWYYGWKATTRIHLFDRQTLKWLKWVKFEEEDFGEVPSPDEVVHQQWIASLKEGDLVCDCRFRHLKIASRDGDNVLLSDGSSCSLRHCCDPADHPEPHPPVTGFGDLDYEHGAKGPRYGSDENF